MNTSEPREPIDLPGVLIASSNPLLRREIIDRLPPSWRPVEEAVGGAEALGKLESSECRILLLDHQLPDLNVEELKAMVHVRYPGVQVQTIDPKVSSTYRLQDAAAGSIAGKSDPESALEVFEGMIGGSAAMRAVYRAVKKVAPRDTSVLITGETGTGKELVAHAIHRLSPRAGKPLVVINCAAIPEALLESELFGYVRGAFTGAAQSRLGRIQAANGGTLFLDEIGEMPVSLQSKLLRFLESGELQRLGSTETWKADVRIVAATNRNLRAAQADNFREDLYYRLCVFPIMLPALRERRDDIADLARHFLKRYAPYAKFSESALCRLEARDWPGNVRELKHVIERTTILSSEDVITDADFIFESELVS